MASTTINNANLTRIPVAPTAVVGTNTTQIAITAFVQKDLNLKAPLENPTFTRTVTGITKAIVGLGSVNNTSDAAKPVSTVQLAALNAKEPLANPTFTGTVKGITSTMVGLGSVDNTTDATKPVSTAQQTAFDLKVQLPMIVGSSPTSASGTIGQIVVHNEILYMCIKSYVNSESGAVWCVIYIDSFIR